MSLCRTSHLLADIMITLLLGTILFLITVGVEKWPPSGINNVYGYRTKRSMASEEAWNDANDYSNRLMKLYALILMGCELIILWSGLSIGWDKVIMSILMVVIFIALVWKTENMLKQNYGQ